MHTISGQNVYMSPFDHFAKRELRCAGYVRYVDDFLLFAEPRRCRLEHVRASVQGWLNHARHGNTVGASEEDIALSCVSRGSLTVHARLPTQQGR